jgi:hypothetical protein
MKTITLFLITVLSCSLLHGQTGEECVSCSQNTINFEGYASGIGTENQASGEQSFVGGYQSNAEGNYSMAFGYSAYSGGKNAISLGYQANATGMYSVAIGRQAYAQSPAAFALGLSVNAQAESSYVFGEFLKATAGRTITIGHGAGIGVNYLTNNIPESMMIGINSNVPTFFVSNSNGAGKTGRIGIGNVTAPQAKLHIRADENYDTASVFIQSFNDNKPAYLWMGNKNFGITKHSTTLEFLTGGDYVFGGGNVGIGTNSPDQKLDVNGTIKATGFQLVNNTQGFGKILQSDEFGNATWADPPSGGCTQCDSTTNTGEFSSTLGKKTTASDFASFASGYEVLSSNAFSFALGSFLTASGANSLAIGSFAIAEKYSSMVIGVGFNNDNRLKNDITNSLMIGFGSNVPTFFVEGYHGINRTGRIGIGNVTAPQAKLHIRADENYDTASVFIQAFDDNKPAYLWMGNKNFGMQKQINSLEFLTDGDYLFNQGNTGFGTNQPAAKVQVKDGDIFIEDIDRGIIMKSPDGNCWRGTVNNQGMLEFTQVDCQTLETGINSPEPSNFKRVRIYPNPASNQVFINCEETLGKLQLEISDINGRLILSQKLSNIESSIDLSTYQHGTYLFRLTDKTGKLVATEKVIKE